ncbi:MAG: universal stress protein [Dehalococcoidia bacterium]
MYSKILLTLDGSEVSQQAIPHAVTLAKQTGAEVILLQVIDSESQMLMRAAGATIEPIAVGQVTADIAHEAVLAEREEAEANLNAVKEAMTAQGVAKITTMVREGYASDEIVAAADETGVDMVVIATHGRSGISRAILGSVADHVMRNTPSASVLLVRARED